MFWQLWYALKSYEQTMPKNALFNVVATVGIDETHPRHIKEYEQILAKMYDEFPFFWAITHKSAVSLGYPRSYNKILGPSLLPDSDIWDNILPNVVTLDVDVLLTNPFPAAYYVNKGEMRFWEAIGIAPTLDILLNNPYGPSLLRAGGIWDKKEKWFQHSAYHQLHKEDLETYFKDQKEVYKNLYPVFKAYEDDETIKEKQANFGVWFNEMYSAAFAAIRLGFDISFYDSPFHTSNAEFDIPHTHAIFLHFFIGAKDGRFWSKFWDFAFPFTDKEWIAIETANKALKKEKHFINTKYIVKFLLKHRKKFNKYRELRDKEYNDVVDIPSHDTFSCAYCKKRINEW